MNKENNIEVVKVTKEFLKYLVNESYLVGFNDGQTVFYPDTDFLNAIFQIIDDLSDENPFAIEEHLDTKGENKWFQLLLI